MSLLICQSMGLDGQISRSPGLWRRRFTVDLEGLSRLGFDPFSINIGYILLEKGLVVQLAK